MNILIALVLLTNIAVLAVALIAFYQVKRVYREIKSFVTPVSADQPSPLAQTIDAASVVMARAFTAQLKATFMASQSAEARGQKAIAGDLAIDVLSNQSPLAAGILQMFPSVAKHLRRNPNLAGSALNLLSNIGQKQGGDNGSKGSKESPQFKF